MLRAAIIAWALASTLVVANIVSGFVLSSSADTSPTLHLILALGSLALGIISHFVLLQKSQRQLEEWAISGFLEDSNRETIRQSLKQAQANGFVSLAILLISIITGTIAQAGKWPIVHIIIGCLLAYWFIRTFILWWKFQMESYPKTRA